MRIIRDVSTCPAACKGAVIALGNFDGIHLGHQAIITHARQIASEQKKPLAAMTFEPHPREFLSAEKTRIRIYPFRRKAQLFEQAGIDTLFALRFNAQFAQTSAQDFIAWILHEALGAAHVVTGYNFFFGHGRKGDKELLASEAARLGFGYSAHPPVTDAAGHPISSSRIRHALRDGHIDEASRQLGRAYAIEGRVIHGKQLGGKLGFPTANIPLAGLFLPRFGVYTIRATLQNGQGVSGVANLGIKPSFAGEKPLLEAHLFDFSGDLYGTRLSVELLDFLREEQKFPDIAALSLQIAADVQKAREITNRGTA